MTEYIVKLVFCKYFCFFVVVKCTIYEHFRQIIDSEDQEEAFAQ